MADTIRAALERLVELDGLPDSWSPAGIQAWDDAIAAGKAALAEQQGKGPSDIPPGPFSEHELREQWNQQADEFNQWDSLDSCEQLAWAQARAIQRDRNARPTPPAEGEVAELVTLLAVGADCSGGAKLSPDQCHRAAELLEQRHPTPVPVSERLPGPEDCDAEGRCWLFSKVEKEWRLINAGNPGVPHLKYCFSHWLPATALPLPSGEVEK